ncbi:MAG: ribosome silencing factor [Endomicrobium sp.]|nr:ribosome silencing factor [Endomicrobium sp.]
MSKIDFYKLALQAAKIAESKKAVDTVILDIQKLTTVANYFVITTAESRSQINAICDEIEKQFKISDLKPLRREGVSSSSWRAIDFGGIIVHVMSPAIRTAYSFEKLWDNADIVELEETKNKVVKKTVKKKSALLKSKAKNK